MSTSQQDKEFERIMISNVEVQQFSILSSALDEAIDYIGKTFAPEDVFSDNDLEHWAEKNGYTKE